MSVPVLIEAVESDGFGRGAVVAPAFGDVQVAGVFDGRDDGGADGDQVGRPAAGAAGRGIFAEGHVADVMVRLGRFITIPGDGAGLAVIDWPAAIAALDDSLPCSGSENRMLRLAASLADGTPVNLRNTLTGLDDHNIQLVINAILHASGHRTPSGFRDHF